MNKYLIEMAKKAADNWRGTDAYHQAATIIDMLIDEITKESVISPCDVCIFSSSSSSNRKPCNICPATTKIE